MLRVPTPFNLVSQSVGDDYVTDLGLFQHGDPVHQLAASRVVAQSLFESVPVALTFEQKPLRVSHFIAGRLGRKLNVACPFLLVKIEGGCAKHPSRVANQYYRSGSKSALLRPVGNLVGDFLLIVR